MAAGRHRGTGWARACVGALLGGVVLFITLPASAAAAGWSAGRVISDDQPIDRSVGLSAGETIAVWAGSIPPNSYVVRASRRAPHGLWSAPVEVDPARGSQYVLSTRVAVDDLGNATAVWLRQKSATSLWSSVWASDLAAGSSSWSPAVMLSSSDEDVSDVHIRVLGDGRTAVAWTKRELDPFFGSGGLVPFGRIVTRDSISSSWSAPTTLQIPAPPSTPLVVVEDLVIDENGRIVVAWSDGRSVGIASRDWSSTGWNFSTALNLDFADSPRVVVDREGTITLIWVQETPVTFSPSIVVRRLPTGSSTWGSPVVLDAVGVVSPRLAVDSGGSVTALWVGWNGRNSVVRSSTLYSTTTAWTSPVSLSTDGGDGLQPDLAVSSTTGAILATWTRHAGDQATVEAALRLGGSQVWTPTTVTIPGNAVHYSEPRPTIDSNEEPVIVWLGLRDGQPGLLATSLDSGAPIFDLVDIPSTALAGQSLTFRAHASDLWSDSALSWTIDGIQVQLPLLASTDVVTWSFGAAGTHEVLVAARDLEGNIRTITRTVTVAAQPDRTAPVLSELGLAGVRAGRTAALRLTLNESARLTVILQARRAGRRVDGKCVRPTRATRTQPACTLFTTVRTIRGSLPKGSRRVSIPTIAGGRKLSPGTYRVVITATDTAGNATTRTKTLVVTH